MLEGFMATESMESKLEEINTEKIMNKMTVNKIKIILMLRFPKIFGVFF